MCACVLRMMCVCMITHTCAHPHTQHTHNTHINTHNAQTHAHIHTPPHPQPVGLVSTGVCASCVSACQCTPDMREKQTFWNTREEVVY